MERIVSQMVELHVSAVVLPVATPCSSDGGGGVAVWVQRAVGGGCMAGEGVFPSGKLNSLVKRVNGPSKKGKDRDCGVFKIKEGDEFKSGTLN